MTRDRATSRRVELFVRSLSPKPAAGPTRRHLDRLRAIEASDPATDVRVGVWGREVALSTAAVGTERGRQLLGKIASFRKWAERRGVSLDPFFETRTARGDLVGEDYAALALPVACLAEYESDRLVNVSPYVAGSAICSVSDHIGRLEERTADEPPVGREEPRSTGIARPHPPDDPAKRTDSDGSVSTVVEY